MNTPIVYAPPKNSALEVTYSELNGSTWPSRYGEDPILGDLGTHSLEHAGMLAESPHWEDRIRALVMAQHSASLITLPDRFPCIYEDETSPHRAGVVSPRIFPWVVSPDFGMLQELLPLYQELWDAYHSQWPSPGRIFKLGRLNRLRPVGVYRPGTTLEQVIARTFLTHDGMYRLAPEHLKKMHPRHASWTRARAERENQ